VVKKIDSMKYALKEAIPLPGGIFSIECVIYSLQWLDGVNLISATQDARNRNGIQVQLYWNA
jgi:hypothetical protein